MLALSLSLLTLLAGQVAAHTPSSRFSPDGVHIRPREDRIVPEECVAQCGVLETYKKCEKKTDCACTEDIHDELGACFQCALKVDGAEDLEGQRQDFQGSLQMFERACKHAGKEFAAIALEVPPGASSAASIAVSRPGVIAAVGVLMVVIIS
ncbi:hypothetical protein C8Q76DRAFT_738505 [Earliella scabrosa]|nr:hypothetical protein C8Q76DRAFT_738505 [Earliella scabrosa]